ncbi:LysM peptidoglycan-binding domain-containing protein [Deferribacter thermophilus]|uniref:lytic transglycosylase domain-containing protein n=1 Tax=Deferribacter thermophilus TaxID=53573 RepID=UPI003C1E6D0A
MRKIFRLIFILIFLSSCSYIEFKGEINKSISNNQINTQTPKTIPVKKTKLIKDLDKSQFQLDTFNFQINFNEIFDKKLSLNLDSENYDQKNYDIPIVINKRVKYFIKRYTKTYPTTFQKWLNNANKYIYIVKDIFRRMGLPTDLACLPFAESGFDVYAYSPAGAGGMWQFMESTGKIYGLKNNFWMDERRDFEKATIAAAKYLKYLYEYFNDWYLAIAAYNGGFYKVMKATQRYKTKDFFKLSKYRYLKRETKDYVPKFIALTIIYKNYLRYGFEPPTSDPLLFDKIKLNQPVNLYVIADLLNTDFDTLKELNPALKKPITPPDDEFALRIPFGTKHILEQKIANMSPEELLQVKIYYAKKKESLKRIAKKFNISVNSIKKLNGLYYDYILFSGPIFIPIKKYEKSLAMQNFKNDINAIIPKVYIVKRGDTFYGIAHRFGMTVGKLLKLNKGINPRLIRPGDPIIISKESYKYSYNKKTRKYRIQKGDTLWDIAKRFNTTVEKLKRKNKLKTTLLTPGDYLIIPN